MGGFELNHRVIPFTLYSFGPDLLRILALRQDMGSRSTEEVSLIASAIDPRRALVSRVIRSTAFAKKRTTFKLSVLRL